MSDNKPIQLFEKQKRIYPKRVWGKYRKVKWLIMMVTLSVYYLAPWIRWDRGPNAPDQAILIDIANSRAYFFFIEIWPQEVYYITGLLILAAVALFFVTSLFGRVWCGYSCPQTVWTDLFVWVERIFQGDRNTRMRRDKAPLNFDKLWRKTATHLTWIIIGFCTGGAWVFYYNDAPTLMEQLIHFDVPWSVTGWIVALAGSTYLMAGYAREQVCTYMCPYARFQSAMFDKDSLIISYDKKRGEPRGKWNSKKQHNYAERRLKYEHSDPVEAAIMYEALIDDEHGDCIACTACVQVCPMGIDIRDGLQMECIACGLCVDACNNVMDKLDLPRGLVRYDTMRNQKKRGIGGMPKLRLLRPRTFYYACILCFSSGIMLYTVLNRSPLELHVLHDRNPLFVKLSDGTIRNGYDIKILNKTHDDKHYKLTISGLQNAKIIVQGSGNLSADDLTVFADQVGHFRVFTVAKKQPEYRQNVVFNIQDLETNITDDQDSIFISRKK